MVYARGQRKASLMVLLCITTRWAGGYAWLKRVLLKEGAIVSYAQHGAKDNPWIESFWRRFKTENGDAFHACAGNGAPRQTA